MVRYARAFHRKASQAPAEPTGVHGPRRSLVLTTALASVSMLRDPQGVTMQGEVSLWYLSIGLSESWILNGGKWSFNAGGGLDYFSPDGEGKFSIASPIGISNWYDVDSGPGYHAEFDVERSLGENWWLVFGVGYLIANLEGEHRFVVSGISGVPVSADFDLTGPQASLGLAHRF